MNINYFIDKIMCNYFINMGDPHPQQQVTVPKHYIVKIKNR